MTPVPEKHHSALPRLDVVVVVARERIDMDCAGRRRSTTTDRGGGPQDRAKRALTARRCRRDGRISTLTHSKPCSDLSKARGDYPLWHNGRGFPGPGPAQLLDRHRSVCRISEPGLSGSSGPDRERSKGCVGFRPGMLSSHARCVFS